MSNTPMAANPLTRAVLEIDEYASGLGWDQPARLFALVDTARLRSQEPALAAQLGLEVESETAGLTPIEQDEIASGKPLDGIPFHPYYTVHDIMGVSMFLMAFTAVIFFAPEFGGYFLEYNNFNANDPL